jgi:hypothetical protein
MRFQCLIQDQQCRIENYIGPNLQREVEDSLCSLSISFGFDRFRDFYRRVRGRARNVTLCLLS